MGCPAVQGLSVQEDLAAGSGVGADDGANHLRAACTDKSREAHDFTGANLKGSILQEGRGQVFDLQHHIADTKVLLDEDAGKFMVTRARDLQEANPDVLDFADVTGCNLDIDESRSELMREDKDGKEVSYNPPRYEYSYDFYITIFVNNPYFDEMRFRLNSSSVDITPPPALRPGMAGGYNPETNVEYRSCKRLGEEIRQALTQVRRDVREKIEQAAAPRTAVTCPYCGATTTPDASGCCEYCGSAIGG